MDKAIFKALKMDTILARIEPCGDTGRHIKTDLPVSKPGDEKALSREYARLQAVIDLLNQQAGLKEKLVSQLSHLAWLPTTLKALSTRTLSLHECFEIKQFIHYYRQVIALIEETSLHSLYKLPDLSAAYAVLDPDAQNLPSFTLSAGFDKSLSRFIPALQDKQMQKRKLENELMETARTAHNFTKQNHQIVVSRMQQDLVHELSNSQYYYLAEENFANLTFRLKDTAQVRAVKADIQKLMVKLHIAEDRALENITIRLRKHLPALQKAQFLSAKLDWDIAKAIFAIQYSCTIPVLHKRKSISIIQAVNLPVKWDNESLSRRYQPINLKYTHQLNVITGPNMGGKTSALNTLGQLCLMTSLALPLPSEKAEMCLFDAIWTNQLETESVSLSSYGREMTALSSVLKKRGRILILADELAKGTNPAEGEAILTAVLWYLKGKNCLCIAATHYDKPAHLQSVQQFAIKGIDELAFDALIQDAGSDAARRLDYLTSLLDYQLLPLSKRQSPPQNAIAIAEVLGVPEAIIAQAKKLLNK